MDPERRREALAEGHIGLASVTQRVEANGGELRLQTTPESGTQVWARLLDQVPGARS
jgi:signal transduction histidine kinase